MLKFTQPVSVYVGHFSQPKLNSCLSGSITFDRKAVDEILECVDQMKPVDQHCHMFFVCFYFSQV